MVEKENALIGTSDFVGNRAQSAYYVDKTQHLRGILKDGGLVTLITRPRRFGKSLMMTTLQAFFEMDYENPASTSRQEALFKGLAVLQDRDFCRENMGKWPVISLSLKEVDGLDFKGAFNQLAMQIKLQAIRFRFLRESKRLSPELREMVGELCELRPGVSPHESLLSAVQTSINVLELALFQHFGRRVILLIDEYDVPLQKAREGGFYNDMLKVFRLTLGAGLKDNRALRKAVLTGCLRIAKESVFTGLNNFICHSVSDDDLSEAFGFTEAETQGVLHDFGLSKYSKEVKQHYDGYQFGHSEIYAPWDVLNFCRDAVAAEVPRFPSYWVNSSENRIISDFLEYAGETHFEALAALMKGKAIAAQVDESISYAELDASHSPEKLLAVLYMTGYLTKTGTAPDGSPLLRIPNEAVRECFKKCIDQHFSSRGAGFCADAKDLAKALVKGDIKQVRRSVSLVLAAYASVRDSAAEGFYHGFLTGLLSCAVSADARGYYSSLSSNREAGDGYADLTFICTGEDTGVVLEFKKSSSDSKEVMLQSCKNAMTQIKSKNYCQDLRTEGFRRARVYGMAFHGKKFEVLGEEIAL